MIDKFITTARLGATTIVNDLTNNVRQAASRATGGLSESAIRLAGQIGIGGAALNQKRPLSAAATQTAVIDSTQQAQKFEQDWRVRLALPQGLASYLLTQTSLLAPLATANGVVFPFTPQITLTYAADWQAQKLTHSNYAAQHYNSSEVQDIQIMGTFVAQTTKEAEYLLAVMTFFKLVTKMFFGEGEYVGNPPPVLFLYGYGKYQWNRVPVVVKNFQMTMPQDVDYIALDSTDPNSSRVPTSTELSIMVAPVYSRKQLSKFDYKKFASGELISGGFI
jgi:hypothetical protein